MIRKLTLENYRSFESYKLEDLARVNLLVGPNNCGKTSILEAVNFLAAQGDPRVLIQSTRRRGETDLDGIGGGTDDTGAGTDDYRQRRVYELSHQFYGHVFEFGSEFKISSDCSLKYVSASVQPTKDSFQSEWPNFDLDSLPPSLMGRSLAIRRPADEDVLIPVSDGGSLYWPPSIAFGSLANSSLAKPVRLVSVESLSLRAMAPIWDQILLGGNESNVIAAMQILEEDLISVHFLAGDRARGSVGLPGIVLGFRGADRRVPIGSHGDGMRRLLALAVVLTDVSDGLLLVDEVDTGLHWTVMEDMWRLVVETARESSIQVFATTHSYDCVRGLASLLTSRPDLAEEVSIQKMERSLPQAVAFDADNIKVAAEQNIELR